MIGYLLLGVVRVRQAERPVSELKLFHVVPPPPDSETFSSASRAQAEDRPAPQIRKSSPAPAVATPVVIPMQAPVPLATAPISGLEEGTGAGGRGVGAGNGIGDGGGARAQRVSGGLRDTDYPAEARRAGIEGIVFVRFTVETNGRVGVCAIARSSGDEALDETTCRLIKRRFRYRPARDATGRPIVETITNTYEWRIGKRPPD